MTSARPTPDPHAAVVPEAPGPLAAAEPDRLAPAVLVVEDEPPLRRFLRAALGAQGYRVLEAGGVGEAMLLLTTHNPALVLLDLGLPDGDGLDLTREVRGFSQVPIVVLSARGREADKVAALDAGADDYLTKPFGVLELTARMRAALRRAQPGATAHDPPVLTVGPLVIDRAQHTVTRAGEPLRLTPIEFKLLVHLAEHVGRVLTHRQLLHAVWGPTHARDDNHLVRVHVAELRKKVEVESARPVLLRTEPGVGYRLCDPEG